MKLINVWDSKFLGKLKNWNDDRKDKDKNEESLDCSTTNKNKDKACLKKLNSTITTLDFSDYGIWATLWYLKTNNTSVYNNIVKWGISVKYSWGTKISTQDIAQDVANKYTHVTDDMAMCRMENLATDDLEKAFKDVTKYVNDFWDYGCVKIDNPRQKVEEKIGHIMEPNFYTNSITWKRVYRGLHSLYELDESEYIKEVVTIGVNQNIQSYEAKILVNEDWEAAAKWNNIPRWDGADGLGVSSMFPDSWSRQRIIDEVTYAVTYNNGRDLTWSDNEYKWLSKNNVQLNFYLSSQWTTIPSYFPKIY